MEFHKASIWVCLVHVDKGIAGTNHYIISDHMGVSKVLVIDKPVIIITKGKVDGITGTVKSTPVIDLTAGQQGRYILSGKDQIILQVDITIRGEPYPLGGMNMSRKAAIS
jgi:cyanophycinase-like exopeptidase